MTAAASPRRGSVEEGASLGGQGSMAGGRSGSAQGEVLISRRPSWPAAPDHELGKGQPPGGRGCPVRAEEDPRGALARSMRAGGSMNAQQALGGGKGETLTPLDSRRQQHSTPGFPVTGADGGDPWPSPPPMSPSRPPCKAALATPIFQMKKPGLREVERPCPLLGSDTSPDSLAPDPRLSPMSFSRIVFSC